VSAVELAVEAARASGDYDLVLAELPYARFLGFSAKLVGEVVVLRLPFLPSLVGNVSLQAIHGGVVGAALESCALLQLAHERGTPIAKTIDFTVDYLRMARAEELHAVAEVQRIGKRIANVRMRAYQQREDQPVALGRGNFLLG
jgi:uncharacterized protein (TIGR00369 family)